MAKNVEPVEIPLSADHVRKIQQATGNVTLIRGHIFEGKLNVTGIQHIIASPFEHNWPGGSAFAHEWPGGGNIKE